MVFECKPIRVLLGLVLVTVCVLLVKGYLFIAQTPDFSINNYINNSTLKLLQLSDVPSRNFTCSGGLQLSVVSQLSC